MEPAINMFDTHKSIQALVAIGIKEKQAEGIVDLVSKSRDYDFARLATKDQLEAVKTEINAKVDSLDKKIDSVQKEMKADIATLKWDVLKWIIPFFLTNTLALAGFIIAFFFK